MKKILAIALLATLTLSACARNTANDAFATCITNSGATFYGAFWCSHCADQKELFGDSVDLLPYVECDPSGKNADVSACAAAGIVTYPTWIFADGTKTEGVESFEELSKATSCPLPGEESVMLKQS